MHISHRTIAPEHAECPGNLYEGGSSRVRINCSKHPHITVGTQVNCMACECVVGGGGGMVLGGIKLHLSAQIQSGFSMKGTLNPAYMQGGL